ncbi:MAG: patatin-like phospholipase family protein [Betaproteobacteria bacterium]|nr:patatin-like phospholipase family protein [Betaproteobacteria bacterium]
MLAGGGARAAYQAGVLSAVRQLVAERDKNPFAIISGTSAGAINAAALAVFAENLDEAVGHMLAVWGNFHARHVYRADQVGIAKTGGRWLSALAFGWLVRQNPRSLLDNTPLRHLLSSRLDFSRIQRAIGNGAMHAVSITVSGYTSGESISFFQAAASAQPWSRMQRARVRAEIKVDHLLASSAIPFFFPAVKINREYFGDGSMRQIAPISPAIHLGADRVLVICAGRMEREERRHASAYPSLAQIAGHALSSIFLDSLEADIERLQRINKTVSLIPAGARESDGATLRPIDVIVIAPSERLDFLAAKHVRALPRSVRAFFDGIGAMNKEGGALASYLLFEAPYTRALIDLGYRDAMARASELRAFLV